MRSIPKQETSKRPHSANQSMQWPLLPASRSAAWKQWMGGGATDRFFPCWWVLLCQQLRPGLSFQERDAKAARELDSIFSKELPNSMITHLV